MAEAQEETNEFAETTEGLMLKLAKVKEEVGAVAFHRLLVMNMIDMQEKATGGDDFVFWKEENSLESTQRVNTLTAKLCMFHGECCKFAVEWCVNKMRSKAGAEVDVDLLGAKLGLFSEDCTVLFHECAKSAAELCIKKMRFGALVDKLDKRTILKNEIDEASRMRNELVERLMSLKQNLMVKKLARKEQGSQAYAIVQQKDAGGAVMDDKPTEISKGKSNNVECSVCNERVRNINGVEGSSSFAKESIRVKRSSAFSKESIRVLVEMMKGVKFGEKLGPGVDEATALADEWTDAMAGKCVTKVWVGVLVDKHSIFEVLKSEIAENWKMEKEVKDRLVIYQRKHVHLAQGFATDIVEEKISKLGLADDETIEEKNSGVGTVLEVDETIEEKNSGVGTVVEVDETIEEKNSGVGTVEVVDETIEEKNSTVGTVVEVDETVEEKNKHPIDNYGLVWKQVALLAVGIIAAAGIGAVAGLAKGKAKKRVATMSGGEKTKEVAEAKEERDEVAEVNEETYGVPEAKEEVAEKKMCRPAKLKENIAVVALKRLFNQEDDSNVEEGNQSRRERKWF